MAGSEKLIVLGDDKIEFLKRCAIKSIPTVAKIVEQIQSKRKGGKGKTSRKVEKKKQKEEEAPKRKKKKIDEEPPKPKPVAKENVKKKQIVEVPIKSSSSSSSSDSEDEKKREQERQRKREEEEEKEKKKAKDDRRKRKEEKQKEKERAEKMKRIEEEAMRRRRRENEEEIKRRKRKVVEDSDDEHPNIVIESATDSDVEMVKPVAPIKKKPPTPVVKKEPVIKSRKSTEKSKVKIVEGKDRKQTLLEFNCITSPQLEIKEINEFVELREMLKEYGVSEEYRRKLNEFPEEQLLTCDSDACPFLLEYQRPFSALYEEARRKWTPSLDTPSSAHLRSKCVNCDKTLSHVTSQTWRKLLGANSFYCSVKCISGKVEKVLKDSPDAETVTVMNALTGETVRGGVYTRELKAFFLLSPNWMPFSVATTIPGTGGDIEKQVVMKKEKQQPRRDVSPLKEKKTTLSSTKIPKKSTEQTENMRMSTKQSFENALIGRAEKYRIRVERETIKEMAINIEDMLFERYDRNLSHPKYRNWKVQFLQMFEQEKAKLFVINVLMGKLSIEKIVAFEVTQLRNPQNWQVRAPRKPGYQNDRNNGGASTSRVGVSPLDAIIGDDNRDTTGEHLSHAFSKNCRICQSKQIADAQEKINKENEERDLRERREKNKARMAEMRLEELKRKQQLKEEKLRKEHEIENHSNGNGFDDDANNDDDDYGAGAGSPGVYETDFASSFRTHRSSVEPSCSKNEEDDWRCSFRLFAGDAKICVEAVPIFYKNDGTLPLMKLCKQVIDGRGLEIHQPLHIPQFLNESHTAMNQHGTCAIAVLRLEPQNSKDQAYTDFLEHSLKQELVGQLKINVQNDDLLSVFVYPHKGSQLVHDTLAPLKYNLQTSADCLLLLFIIKPAFAQRFEYSVRIADSEMREQLAKCEREKMAGRSWRKQPSEQESWRRQNSFSEEKPNAARTPPKDLDMRVIAAKPQDALKREDDAEKREDEERKPKIVRNEENGVENDQEEEEEEEEEDGNVEDESISRTKTRIIMNIIDQTDRICDIVDSTKDFMLDSDVCEEDRIKVTQYIESRILEEKRRKKEQRKSKLVGGVEQPKPNHNNGLSEETTFNIPPPQPPVFLNTSIPPPMVPPGVPFVPPNAYPPYAQLPPTTTPSQPAPHAPPPLKLPPGVTDPKAGPAPPRLHPAHLPPGVTDPKAVHPGHLAPPSTVRDIRTDQQIVNEAIRKGEVAPIPEALLISASRSVAPPPPINEMSEMEKRRLIAAPPPDSFPRHLIPPRFQEMHSQRHFGERERVADAYPPSHRRSFSPPASQRYRTPSPPPPQSSQQPLAENGKTQKEENVIDEKPTLTKDDLFPLRFGRNPKKRQVVPEPIVPNADKKKKRGKRARAGKKHAKRASDVAETTDGDEDDDVKEEEEEEEEVENDAPPPPPPPPEDTESETSDSPSPPPPPLVAAATATTKIHAPIFEINKPPAPPPLSSAPPSSVPLPVPPPPPPPTSSAVNLAFSTLLLPPPPPPPPDTQLLTKPSESSLPPPPPLMLNQQYQPNNDYETEWTSSEWASPSTSNHHHQQQQQQNHYGGPPMRGGPGAGGNGWRGGHHPTPPQQQQQSFMRGRGGPSPRGGSYRGGGNGGMRGGGGPPPHFYPSPQQQHGGFFGDSPRNQFHHQRGNWRGGPPRGSRGRGGGGGGGYW